MACGSKSSSTESSFEEWKAAARAVKVQNELMRRGLWTKAMACDRGVPCPGCGWRDRFSINTRKNVWFCRASGNGGDAIALAQHIDGTGFLAAVETVNGSPPPDHHSQLDDRERQAIAVWAERAAANDLAKRRDQEASSARFRERARRKAYDIRHEAVPFAGTMVEDYLAMRGIMAPLEARLRFHPSLPYWDRPKDQGGIIVHQGPAVVAAIEGPDGRFAAVHRTWIDLSKPKGKAFITHRETGDVLPAKKVLGSMKGGTILLIRGGVDAEFPGDRRGARMLFLGEGIETVLAVQNFIQAWPDAPAKWSAAEFRAGVSLGNICGKSAGRVRHPIETRVDCRGRARPHFVPNNEPLDDPEFPIIPVASGVRELVLLGDGDSEPFFTRMALERAGKRFARAYPHLLIRLWTADPGQDFNDMILEISRGEMARPDAERVAAHV